MTSKTAQPPTDQADPVPAAQAGDGFLANLIRKRCAGGSAEAGVVFRITLTTIGGEGAKPMEGDADILAIHPAISADAALPGWVELAAHAASKRVGGGEHGPSAVPINGAEQDQDATIQWIVTVPLQFGVGEAPSAIAAFLVSSSRDSIEDAMAPLGVVEREFLANEQRHADSPLSPVDRMNSAVAPLLAANAQDKFYAAAVAVCNEIEAATGATRVSVGFLRGRDIRLGAISHTEKLVRSMQVVRDIENAMEECLDQDREVVTPAHPESIAVDRAANELSRLHGPSSVCVLPLRRRGEPIGALCVERGADAPLREDEVESARLACELVTARLHDLAERDRWFGARIAASVRTSAASWIGPTHTWAKLLAIACFALLAFLVLAKGTDRVSAPVVIQTVERRVAPAPFDGYLESRAVQVGDRVRAGDVLATLDSSGLLLERAEAAASLQGYEAEADRARGAGKTADALIAGSRADELRAQVELLDWKIERSQIRTPIDGVVVQGDLDAIIGAPVGAGDTLFVIAPLEALRAAVAVDASRIADVRLGATGTLATTADPASRVPFTVSRIDPIATDAQSEQAGAFNVIVDLDAAPDWLRPGMEGVAKVDAGRKRYAALWSRRLVDWVRMKLWI